MSKILVFCLEVIMLQLEWMSFALMHCPPVISILQQQHQYLSWNLLIGTLQTNLCEIRSKIHVFSLKKKFENAICKIAAILSRPHYVKLFVLPCFVLSCSIISQNYLTAVNQLNQWWLIVCWALKCNLNQNVKSFLDKYAFENNACKMDTIFSSPNVLPSSQCTEMHVAYDRCVPIFTDFMIVF